MANLSFINGFVPVDHLLQPGLQPRSRRYFVSGSDSVAMFVGDAVKSTGAADATTGLATIAQAAATNTLRGVVIGFDRIDGVAVGSTNLYITYRPASTAMYALVVDDPFVIFEAQANAAVATSNVGDNVAVVVGSGNTVTGLSGMQVDATSGMSTSDNTLRILGFPQRADNTINATYNRVLVSINDHELKGTTGT